MARRDKGASVQVGRGNRSRDRSRRGDKSASHVVHQRTRQVQDWLAQGVHSREVVHRFAKEGVSVRTARRYIALARARWILTTEEQAPTIREARLHELRRLATS